MAQSGKIPPRTVLVTGAGARIGHAIALDLADAGWRVAVHYLSGEAEAAGTVSRIEKNGGHAIALQADLCDEVAVRNLIPAAAEKLGPVTALINNASLFEEDTIDTMDRDSWQAHMVTNLYAPAVLAQVFDQALPADQQGCIINVIDQRVWALTPKFLSYTLSKSALWTLTQTLAQAMAPNIRVMGIGPGPTLRNQRQSEEDFRRQVDNLPLARETDPADICAAVRFILDTPSLTGQMLALDGGQHLAWQTPGVADVRE